VVSNEEWVVTTSTGHVQGLRYIPGPLEMFDLRFSSCETQFEIRGRGFRTQWLFGMMFDVPAEIDRVAIVPTESILLGPPCTNKIDWVPLRSEE